MGKKWNRRAMTLGLGAAAALLTGCFASDGLVTEEADLVFRNCLLYTSDAADE